MLVKVILSNDSALTSKYGEAKATILKAVKELVAADKKRGIDSRYIALDNLSDTEASLKPHSVKIPHDPEQNKAAVDAVYDLLAPDYILLLGGPDIIPHQDLINPLFEPNTDPDSVTWSDLPYACEGAYSKKPESFVGPTRVVGRIPDITGEKNPEYLVSLLSLAANSKPQAAQKYASHLGISADVWKESSKLSLKNVFGSGAQLQISPPNGPNWSTAQLARLSHFINCHGAQNDPRFYGQKGNDYPIAHDASVVHGAIKMGTVLAAECCYGAELYNPSFASGQTGMANTYLANGCIGYMGSSTIAYGPAEGNSAADLICQFFLRQVLKGASLGRAMLQAQQEFVTSSPSPLDPTDLKTLSQFMLLGDPGLVAAQVTAPHALAGGQESKFAATRERRMEFIRRGAELQAKPAASSQKLVEAEPPAALRKILSELSVGATVLSFPIERAYGPKTPKAFVPMQDPIIHVVMAPIPPRKERPFMETEAVVVKMTGETVISIRRLVSRGGRRP